MKRKIFLLVLILFAFCCNQVCAHDDVVIHSKITENATKNTIIEEYLSKNLNLKEGLETILPLSGGKTILTWLKDGSTAEDSPMCRASNHFHDPLKTWDTAAMSDLPWWVNLICNSWTSYYSNVTWATGFTSPTSTPIPYDPNNSKSPNVWANARTLYLNALTATTKADRETYFTQTFMVLGQVMHLLQDMSVPAHVRNDFQSHLIFNGFCANGQCSGNPIRWFGNPLEYYIKNNSQLVSTAESFPPTFTNPRLTDFWDADQYNGGNPSNSTMLGLAEITNANYFSNNTIPNNIPSEVHSFPYPQIDAANYNICEDYEMGTTNLRRYICRNNQSGPLAKITSISFLNEKETIANANLSSLRLVLDDNVHNAYAKELLPLAIGYSSEVLKHFFRGQLDVEMDAGSLKIRNTSTETMTGGKFELYYDNASEERKGVRLTLRTIFLDSWANGKSYFAIL